MPFYVVEKSGEKKEAMVDSLLPGLPIWIVQKKKLISNDLIWWFHRSGIAMYPPTSSKWLHSHFCFRWDGGSGVDRHKPAQKHSLPESLSLAIREKHKSKRELRWDQSKEPEVSSSIGNQGESRAKARCPSGFQHCPSQTSLWKQDILPSAWNHPMLPGLTRPHSLPMRMPGSCLLHCKI